MQIRQLGKNEHQDSGGAQGQVQEAVGSWSSFDPIEGIDLFKKAPWLFIAMSE
jgi:hypothetical protein